MNLKSLGIHIKVADFSRSRSFYIALGFKPVFEYGPGLPVSEDYRGTVFQCGGAKLEIADGHRAVKPDVFQQPVTSPKLSLMVNCRNLHDILKRCSQSHIEVAVPVRHYYWNTLELVIKDPDGTVLVFISPYTKKAAQSLKADETYANPPVRQQ